MTRREALLRQFLADVGWDTATRTPLAGDASTRRYERLTGPQGSAVLMDAPPAAETPASPPGASVAERRALGYNAVARLAGPDTAPFVAIAEWLHALGLSAPAVRGADLEHGFVLLEDLGDALYTHVLKRQTTDEELYKWAVEVLARLHQQPPPSELRAGGRVVTVKEYDEAAMQAEADLVLEWYLPLVNGAPVSATAADAYREAWSAVLPLARAGAPVFVLRDYHADNLIWLPGRDGVAKVGLLDFQDGVIGPSAYDLVSLIEDARRDVNTRLAHDLLDHYCRRMGALARGFDEAAYRRSYAVLGAQRNAKIVGIFARLARRDKKPHYLSYLPRVWRHLEGDLADAALAPLRAWFDAHVPRQNRAAAFADRETSHGR